MYFPQNCDFGSALSKLRNFFGGWGEVELATKSPPWYATESDSIIWGERKKEKKIIPLLK
jgi:hypothetical protein